MARGAGKDPYVYPSTDVLRNKLGIRDNAALRIAEYGYTLARGRNAPDFPMTAAGYLATHRHLFQDIYDWAGKLRTVTLTKGDTVFAFPDALERSLDKRFADLAAKDYLRGLSPEAFAAGAAHHTSELNAIHCQREGNGRAMRLHLGQLAAQAGHRLDQARIPAKAWIEASIVAFHAVDEGPLARVILGALAPAQDRDAPAAAAVPEPYRQLSPDGRLLYAALADKIGREMTKLTPEEKAEMRTNVARELARKEEREGPVVLSAELRRLAMAPAPPAPARTGTPDPARPAPDQLGGPKRRR